MTAPTLRPYLPDDAEVLAHIFRAAIETLTVDDYDEDQRVAWAERADDEEEFGKHLASMLTLVASLDGEVAGFASLRGKDAVEMLYVHPEYVREGVATALVDALEKLGGARGAKALVVEASDTANRFFLRRGYAPQQRNSRMVGDEWLANTTMIKKLGDALETFVQRFNAQQTEYSVVAEHKGSYEDTMIAALGAQRAGLAVVDDQHVHLLEHLPQSLAFAFDPEIHRVAGDQRGPFHLLQHVQLQFRVDVAQKQQRRSPEGFGQCGPEGFEDVEFRVEGVRLVHLIRVLALPAEGLAWTPFQTRQIDAAAFEEGHVLVGKILPHDCQQIHARERAGRR